MQKRRTLLTSALGAACLLANSVLRAGTAQAQAAPAPETLAELPGAQTTGTARMRFWGLAIYDATLWVRPGFRATRYAQHPLALELTYQRSLSGNAIAERSLQEMRRASPLAPEQETRWLAAMQEAFPDVKAGDRITGLHTPGVGARFWFNGQPRATLLDAEFSRLFFGIWLADTTSEPALRSALLARAAP